MDGRGNLRDAGDFDDDEFMSAGKMKSPIPLITSLEQLQAAALERKSVYCPCSFSPCFGTRMPAAFAINMSGHVLLSLFKSGMMIYEPKTKKKT